MDVIMHEWKKRRLFLVLISALVALAVIIAALVLILGNRDAQNSGKTESSQWIPEGQLLVSDLYEGDRLIPEFDLPRNEYETAKFQKKNGLITYSDPAAKLGVDVSEHQENIDWEQVRAAGVDFAILRLGYRGHTEGLLYVDETFERNLENAEAAGIAVGVYFFSQATSKGEAEEEAEFVLTALGNKKPAYPVVFDWEQPFPSEEIPAEDLRAYNCTGEQVTSFAEAFCEKVKKAGLTPAVYFNKTMAYEFLDLEKLGAYDFWYAGYQDAPSLYYDFAMWQYTDSGEIPGIGNVDLNISFKTYQ